jgi:hypothetical protein
MPSRQCKERLLLFSLIFSLELTMSHIRQSVFTIALATAAIGASAQTASQVDAQQKEHQAHVLVWCCILE